MPEAIFEANVLLKTLEPAARARFLPRFQKVELQRGEVLHNQGQAVDRVYFPSSGLVAILSETVAGESVQTGMVGCDGAVGAVEAVGSGRHLSKGLVQIGGPALRLSAAVYREMIRSEPEFRAAVGLYMEHLLTEARQLTVCNALHSVEGRLSRSILDALERGCLDRSLPLTQEALAQMIGAQRTTVAVYLSKMQRDGVLKSGRGVLEIRDMAGLERRACSCRRTLQLAQDEMRSPDMSDLRRSSAR